MSEPALNAIFTEDGYCVDCHYGKWRAHGTDCRLADLHDAGYIIVKPVRLRPANWDHLYKILGQRNGDEAANDYLHSLGLPVEITKDSST